MPTIAEIMAQKKAQAQANASLHKNSSDNRQGTGAEGKAPTNSQTGDQNAAPKIDQTSAPAKSANPLAAALAGKAQTPQTQTKPINPLAQALNKNKAPTAVVKSSPTDAVIAVGGTNGDNSPSHSQSESAANPTTSSADTHFNHPTQPIEMSGDAEKDLKKNIQLIRDNLSDRPLVSQAIPHIMRTLQENPHLRDLLLPEDCRTMVRGLRECYGTAIKEKQERVEKKTVKKQTNAEIASELNDIMSSLS